MFTFGATPYRPRLNRENAAISSADGRRTPRRGQVSLSPSSDYPVRSEIVQARTWNTSLFCDRIRSTSSTWHELARVPQVSVARRSTERTEPCVSCVVVGCEGRLDENPRLGATGRRFRRCVGCTPTFIARKEIRGTPGTGTIWLESSQHAIRRTRSGLRSPPCYLDETTVRNEALPLNKMRDVSGLPRDAHGQVHPKANIG